MAKHLRTLSRPENQSVRSDGRAEAVAREQCGKLANDVAAVQDQNRRMQRLRHNERPHQRRCLISQCHILIRVVIYNAEDRDHALQAIRAFAADYGAR